MDIRSWFMERSMSDEEKFCNALKGLVAVFLLGVIVTLLLSSCAAFTVKKQDITARYITFGQNRTIKGFTLQKISDDTWTIRLDEFGSDSSEGMNALEKIGTAIIESAIAGGALAGQQQQQQPWYSQHWSNKEKQNEGFRETKANDNDSGSTDLSLDTSNGVGVASSKKE